MNHKSLLRRIDQIQELLCDIRLDIISDMKQPLLLKRPEKPNETPRERAIRLGQNAGVFSDPQG